MIIDLYFISLLDHYTVSRLHKCILSEITLKIHHSYQCVLEFCDERSGSLQVVSQI